MPVFRTYSRRSLSPFSGQVQIVENEQVRALTLDGAIWEIQIRLTMPGGSQHENRGFHRVAMVRNDDIEKMSLPAYGDTEAMDDRFQELFDFLSEVKLPFSSADHYEFWLLDGEDESPLALIHSCVEQAQMPNYPNRAEWTAMPASMMKIQPTEDELDVYVPPVNYRFERLVADRAGNKPRARWFNRRVHQEDYPPLLVKEQWPDQQDAILCRRYIDRQAPRLLMLHDLAIADRQRLELAARANPGEVGRFFPLYPVVADEALMTTIRVEDRLRRASANV